MMKQLYIFLVLSIIFISTISFQEKMLNHFSGKNDLKQEQNAGLEGVLVERYYTADTTDIKNAGIALPKGTVTYRIYIDMKPGYLLQAVYGVPGHELRIATTTRFFNLIPGGSKTGHEINDNKINEGLVAFDSWVTMGAATMSHYGILRSDDTGGSVINALLKKDGLITGSIPELTIYGLDLSFFNNNTNASLFSSNNGSWAAFGGVHGPTEDNKVLIAQLTTDGKLSFELNIQIGTPWGGYERYVAKDPEDQEVQCDGLVFPERAIIK